MILKYCKKHGKTEFYVTSTKIKNRYIYRCKECKKEYVKKIRRFNKEKAIILKGGKCFNCGYDKCNSALEFHHVYEDDKLFSISENSVLSWKRIEKELEKCVLLCSNCHRELHYCSSFKLP